MRSIILFSVGFFATCRLWAVPQGSLTLSSNKNVREIESASSALVDAQLHYDTPAVARLLANDFIYAGNDGSIATKAEFLSSKDDIKHRPLKLLEWKLTKLQFYGDTAVALYTIHEKSIGQGKLHEF